MLVNIHQNYGKFISNQYRQKNLIRYVSQPIQIGGIAKRSNAADCKSALSEFDGSNPSPTTIFLKINFF